MIDDGQVEEVEEVEVEEVEETPPAPVKKKVARKRVAKKKPAPPKSDYDLDAAVDELRGKMEAYETEPFKFTYGKREWTMRPPIDADVRVLGNIDLDETQQVLMFLRDLLGDEQWADFPRLSYSTAVMLLDKYGEHSSGVGLGESKAPSDS